MLVIAQALVQILMAPAQSANEVGVPPVATLPRSDFRLAAHAPFAEAEVLASHLAKDDQQFNWWFMPEDRPPLPGAYVPIDIPRPAEFHNLRYVAPSDKALTTIGFSFDLSQLSFGELIHAKPD